jgi:hypothetical protein
MDTATDWPFESVLDALRLAAVDGVLETKLGS